MTAKNTDEIQPETLPDVVERSALPATVEQVVVALSDRDWDGVEDGHIGGTVTPRLPRTLLNRKATEEGGFEDELTGTKSRDVSFVWLADTVTRAWWPERFGKGDEKPACRSRDGITPDPASPAQQKGWSMPGVKDTKGEVPSATCAECFNSQWVDEPPACSSSIEVMVYLLGEERLSLVRFGGMAVSRVNRYLGALNAHIPRRPPLAYVTRCELEEVPTDNGVFLVPRFSVVGDIPRKEAQPLIDLRAEKVKEWQEQLDDDLAEGRTADAEAAAEHAPGEEPF
jgi:hypothetical protein